MEPHAQRRGHSRAAIEDRGPILVHVSAEEAQASERAQAFAKADQPAEPRLEGRLRGRRQRGNVTRIDQRTTGDLRDEIEKRLGSIDPSELLSVADARDVMREANRAAWAEQQAAARERAAGDRDRDDDCRRPQSHDDRTRICRSARQGRVDDHPRYRRRRAGARRLAPRRPVSRRGAATRRRAAFRRLSRSATLAAVTRRGDVFRLNPHKLDLAEIEQRLADVQPSMPSVVEARARVRDQARADRRALGAAPGREHARRVAARKQETPTARCAAPLRR